MPEIEDIKPTSILHKVWFIDRATNPFIPNERACRSLTFQKVEDTVSSSLPPGENYLTDQNSNDLTDQNINRLVGV